jgi:hypothetical protein
VSKIKILRMLEAKLICYGFFRTSFILRELGNLSLLSTRVFITLFLKKSGTLTTEFAKFEIQSIIKDLQNPIKRNFSLQFSTYGMVDFIASIKFWKNPSYVDDYRAKKIFILGPGEGSILNQQKNDLIILLNPVLKNEKLDNRIDYMIIINKSYTLSQIQDIVKFSKKRNVISIFTKIRTDKLANIPKINPMDIFDFYRLEGEAGGPNLLPIALALSIKFEPALIQISGCDMYLGAQLYKPNYKSDSVLSYIKKRKNILYSLAMHNPFAQLTYLKALFLYCQIRNIELETELKFLKHFELAKIYASKFSRKRSANSQEPASWL